MGSQDEPRKFAQKIKKRFLEHVQRQITITDEAEGEIGDPITVAKIEGFEGGRISGVCGRNQLLVASWIVVFCQRWQAGTLSRCRQPIVKQVMASKGSGVPLRSRHPLVLPFLP